jgi:hypothetical protein
MDSTTLAFPAVVFAVALVVAEWLISGGIREKALEAWFFIIVTYYFVK